MSPISVYVNCDNKGTISTIDDEWVITALVSGINLSSSFNAQVTCSGIGCITCQKIGVPYNTLTEICRIPISIIPLSIIITDQSSASCSAIQNLEPLICPLVCSSLITVTPSSCSTNNLYTLSGQVSLTNPPSSGNVTIQIVGGGSQTFSLPQSSPITYNILGQSADGLNHKVYVSISGVNCSDTASFTAPGIPSLVCNKSDNTNCAIPNGSATATASGVTYLWSNGAITATINGLNAGTYTVTVTSTTTSCTNTCSVTVVNNTSNPTANCTAVSNTNCATPNGSASVITNASTPTYLWSNGGTTASISGLNAGTYTVTVTNSTSSCTNTCTATVTNTTTPPSVSCSKVDNTNCKTPNGTATATASGVTYLWSNGGTSSTIPGLNAGTYTVTVTSTTNSCTNTCSVTVANSSSPPSVSCTPTQPTCAAPNGGSVSTFVTGGITPFTYLWSNGVTASSITNIGAGTYTVTVTDNNSCTATCSTILNAPVGCCVINNINLVIGNCYNKGTLTNANDDEYTFSLNPTGNGLGTTYTVSGLHNSPQTGTYGSPTTFGPYLISAGVLNITVVDNVAGTCTKTASVTPPPSCSVCNVSSPVLSVNDNICPSRTGNINLIQGCGAGTFIQYSINNGITWSTVKPLYSTTPRTILARCVNSMDTTCKSPNSIVTTVPKKCPNSGNECSLTANATIDPCNNNGTDNDTTDDYFTIQINATIVNGGSSNKYEVVIGADPLTGIGGNVLNSAGTTYGSPVNVGNTKIFMANGTSNYQLIIRDINNNNCFQSLNISPLAPCSIAPPKSPCFPDPCIPIGIKKN
ncbi:MAG: hypothetical protein IPL95_13710 [Saprospiraceae bacterium]|nr:hypothetical protein [Saprospiraceae bacterium]